MSDTELKRKILYYEIAPDEHNNCFHVLDELSDYLRKQNISVSFCGYDRINISQKSNYDGNNDVLLMVFQDQKSGKFRINLGFDDDTDPYTPNYVAFFNAASSGRALRPRSRSQDSSKRSRIRPLKKAGLHYDQAVQAFI